MITKIASIGLITLSLVMQAFPACSAETVLPVRVTIISYQDYLKMQEATAQTQTAAQTASYTETDIQTYSEPTPLLSFDTAGNSLDDTSTARSLKLRLDTFFARLDRNDDNIVEYDEFTQTVQESYANDWFTTMDANNDNLISRGELALYR